MIKLTKRFHFLILVILTFSAIGFLSVNEIFATSATYENIDSDVDDTIDFRTITNKGSAVDVPDSSISLDETTYSDGDTATVTVTDANANVTSGVIDFATATVSGSSITLTETGTDTGIFSGTFTVGEDAPSVDYIPNSKTAARAQIVLPSGFTNDLTFSDVIENPTQIDGECIKPVTGTLKIEGTLDVQPTIFISYANANYTGVPQEHLETRMYYRAPGEQAEPITLAFTENGNDATYLTPLSAKTLRSQNGGSVVSPDGGWDPAPSNYAGQYFLGLNDISCGGGGGGGLVSPGLIVNALAGLSAGGGGGGSPGLSLNNLLSTRVIDVPEEVEQMVVNHDSYSPLLPMDPNSFEGFDLPFVINDQGFVLGGFTNTLQTLTIRPDTPVTMKYTVYTADKVQHFSIYTNLRDTNDSIGKSDTQILYNDGKELQIKDPNGLFSNAKVTVIEEEDSVKKQVLVEITFAKEMETSHIITRMWDSHLRSGDIHMLDAIKVEFDEPEFVPIPQETEEVQMEELKIQVIPKWVKNNAAWWVDDQIDDDSFVTGIQYLINNGIMYVPNTDTVNSSVTEIPDWIKSNAEWWTDDQISDDEFVKAMQWLVTNGVISIE